MGRNLAVTALAAGAGALALVSCGGGGETSNTGGGGAATTITTSASSSSTSSTTSSSGTGGTGGGGFCAGATDITFGDYLPGDLATTGQKDLYRFTGTKGQVVMIDVDAQFLDDADFDPDHIDSVLTLFDAQGTQLAQNNDPIEYSTGDSRLYTVLPADGEYCVRVAECWSVIDNPAQNCQSPQDKTFTIYDLGLHEYADHFGDARTAEVEKGNDAAAATTIDYAKDNSGYYVETFWGTFTDQDDVDVWSFTLPTDLTPAPPASVRTIGRFYLMQSGPEASGSTAPIGRVTVVDPSAPGVALAAVDGAKNLRFNPRLDLGKPYLLFITRPKGTTGANDFYLVRHYVGWGNPLELEVGVGANDTPATAEPIALDAVDGYIEGDLAMNAQDVDHFVATVPAGVTKVSASCGAQRYGSGLRGLKLSLLASDGTPLSASASDVESETHYPGVSGVPLGNATEVLLKVEATAQDPQVAEAFYQCGIHFKP